MSENILFPRSHDLLIIDLLIYIHIGS